LSQLAASVGLEEVSMMAGRELFIEKSLYYINSELLAKVGITRRPLSKIEEASFPWKVVRKMYRFAVQPLFTAAIGLAGDGESIHAVFRKSDSK
jgi:hypothetical protein